VKKTWAYGYPREDDIKIEEVFQKADLELAVLSAFQVEPEWVESKLNQTTKIIWFVNLPLSNVLSIYLPVLLKTY
jgi:hypothetical protein